MTSRVGAQAAFAEGSRDLAELAGIIVPTKQVERVAEANGERIKLALEEQWQAILAGGVLPLPNREAIPKLYVTIDGTGVPTVPKETEGRQGKAADGRARTREAKIGCLFTQTGFDEKGRPARDPASSSYLAGVDSSARFGQLLYAEARRRGVDRAQNTIVIGDGARWIWNVAGEHFPGAIEIVDLFHAREHLHELSKIVFTSGDRERQEWVGARIAELDRGAIEDLLFGLGELDGRGALAAKIGDAKSYFDNNRERMRYERFRALGHGRGRVQDHRSPATQAIRHALDGARAESIMSLRCCQASGRWDEFWLPPDTQSQVA